MNTLKVMGGTFAALVVACVAWAGWWYTMGKSESQAKDAVRQRLADPESAKFRNVRHVHGKLVCGEFNAKNRVGGYVGYRRFAFAGGDWATFEPSEEELESEAQANELASLRGQQPSRTYFVAKEVFSAIGADCM